MLSFNSEETIDCNSVTLHVQVSLEDITQNKHRVRQDDTVTCNLPEHNRDILGMLKLQGPPVTLILDRIGRISAVEIGPERHLRSHSSPLRDSVHWKKYLLKQEIPSGPLP